MFASWLVKSHVCIMGHMGFLIAPKPTAQTHRKDCYNLTAYLVIKSAI